MTSRELIRKLEAAGWVLDRIRGSHHIYRSPTGQTVPVPHPKKDLPAGTVKSILKVMGL